MIGFFLILLLGTGLIWFSIVSCRDAQHQANLVPAQESAPADSDPAATFVATRWNELDDHQLARFLDDSSS